MNYGRPAKVFHVAVSFLSICVSIVFLSVRIFIFEVSVPAPRCMFSMNRFRLYTPRRDDYNCD
ncbi:Uncharacterized protein APZ42_021209 [Daphnia magna]|uniref:Uncharacterized protein n=1 Tax=Daphnia magna TaxID=35525 RepID=A0A164WVD7_9CRUS|nr:Uncharacterized protein APZ42_021209 [Daphnia magna]